jgi:hypothetical protein
MTDIAMTGIVVTDIVAAATVIAAAMTVTVAAIRATDRNIGRGDENPRLRHRNPVQRSLGGVFHARGRRRDRLLVAASPAHYDSRANDADIVDEI